MLRIEQRDLADRSGVSLETIKRIERTPGPVSAYASTVDAIRRALEGAGIEFLDENGGGDGVRRRLGAPAASPSKSAGSASKAKPAAAKAAGGKARSSRPAKKGK